MFIQSKLKAVLNNGVQILHEQRPHHRTVSVGLFLDHGVKDEEYGESGISHFIEHVLFNPKYMRPSVRRQLEQLIESGSMYEAHTSKEYTRFTITSLPSQLEMAVSALGKLMIEWRVSPRAVDAERSVILHEYASYFGSSKSRTELLEHGLWGPRSLGLFILGRKDTINAITAPQLQERIQQYYTPYRATLVVLGPTDGAQVVDIADRYLGQWQAKRGFPPPASVSLEPTIIGYKTNGERVDVTIGFPAPPFHSQDRHAVALLADLLGGGMKSRLFQELRENRQLVYHIHAYPATYGLGGYVAIDFNCRRDSVREILQLIEEALNTLHNVPAPDDELQRCKAARATAYLQSLEDGTRYLQTTGRYTMLGRDLFVDQEVRNMNMVSSADLTRLSRQLLKKDQMAIVSLGVSSDELAQMIS